jgi:hypothetical protein
VTVDEIRKSLEHGPLFDGYITKHGFAPYLRDYDVIVKWPRSRRFLYRFTHVPLATVTTAVTDSVWRNSWDDVYIDYSVWQNSGSPDGYVWGVCYSVAYPGAKYVEASVTAREWESRFGKPMHEVRIETNGHNIQLIFHDLRVEEIGPADEGV